ncbi:MAG: hypothetical protein HFE30_07010 [Clostridiales bacterium]|nr:hypothetical protein [Clostridiales bacterium]
MNNALIAKLNMIYCTAASSVSGIFRYMSELDFGIAAAVLLIVAFITFIVINNKRHR